MHNKHSYQKHAASDCDVCGALTQRRGVAAGDVQDVGAELVDLGARTALDQQQLV